MPGHSQRNAVKRIIDANINRTKEGLRVVEEIARFIINSPALSRELKKTRHNIDLIAARLAGRESLLKHRDSLRDVGKNIYINELKRDNCKDIFFANIQRLKESIRVLEEFAKLNDRNAAVGLKDIRYKIYDIEKRAAKKILALRYHR